MANGAFYNCEQLTDATLPNSVKYLGTGSFDSCTKLSHVNLNQGLISIGGNCFYGCTGLTEISIPSSVTIIDYHAFLGCSSLSEVSLRNSAVTYIGVQAFNGTAITSIDLPPHLEAIRTRLLTNTPVNTLSIPAGVMRVMPYALYSMKSLKALIIEDSGTTLDFDYNANNRYGRDPFIDDTQDTDGVGRWLYGTKNIETLYLGRNTATWINPEYEFPEQSRADDASTNPFESMESLKNITIGAEVTDASQLVFSLYRNLEQITLLAETPPVLNPLSAKQAASVRVTVPAGCADVYRNANGWSDVVTIEESASISDIMADTAAGPEPVYNLMGIRMDASELPAGIYIKGNRKFIVK
ncbi:MAG: leucine-rich repeat domain-containing protein [Duncaniella sp.]|nr:leucine-rich repeat domain-containing protein [Duncaniella sp.]